MTEKNRPPRRRSRHPRRTEARATPAVEALNPTAERPGAAPPKGPDLALRIRQLEKKLDRMIDARERMRDPAEHTRDSTERMRDPAEHTREPKERPATASLSHADRLSTRPALQEPEGVLGAARELLSTRFYLRQWGRLGLRNRSEEVDEFGYDPVYEHRLLPFFDFLYEKYFRVETHGVERIPTEGRCLLVANHSGTIPVDGMMLRLAVRREHPQHREVRWLAEDAIFHFPFLGVLTNRMGAVRACQENAARLLDREDLVAVFPEGMKGIGKLFRDRYKLQRFGRGGFVKLCLRTRTPVVPVAIIGSEETNPLLVRIDSLARAVGIPYLPVTPTFPLLGPIGLLPAPTKWKITFGEPIAFDNYGAEAADDEVLVGRLSEQVRAEIQSMLNRGLVERRSVWFG